MILNNGIWFHQKNLLKKILMFCQSQDKFHPLIKKVKKVKILLKRFIKRIRLLLVMNYIIICNQRLQLLNWLLAKKLYHLKLQNSLIWNKKNQREIKVNLNNLLKN